MEKVEDLRRTYIFWKTINKIRVCKTMFLNTYGVGEKAIKNWKNSTMTTHNDMVDYDRTCMIVFFQPVGDGVYDI